MEVKYINSNKNFIILLFFLEIMNILGFISQNISKNVSVYFVRIKDGFVFTVKICNIGETTRTIRDTEFQQQRKEYI